MAPNIGVIYTGSASKQEEHGGFAFDDTNVMLLVSILKGFVHECLDVGEYVLGIKPRVVAA